MVQKEIEAVRQAILQTDNILIACHVRPDGDTLGSALALSLALRKIGKTACVVSADGVPEPWSFIPHSAEVLREAPKKKFGLAIGVDADGISRLGDAAAALESAPVVVSIDHHSGSSPFGDIRVHDTKAAAAAELVYALIIALGLEIDRDIACCLMAGLVGDTGGFRFPNVTPRTFEIAAELARAGASSSDIAKRVYEDRGLTATKVLGHVLAGLRTTAKGRIVWGRVSKKDFEKLGADDTHTEGVVNYIRAVQGSKVGLLFREAPNGTVRVSLRSNQGIDVAGIARTFGGGGHPAAAGCTIESDLETAEKLVVEEVLKWMDS